MKILQLLEAIPDPRMKNKVVHPLSTILFVAICAILSGCECWEDLELYCKMKYKWLSQYVNLENGIPSHYTFRRVFTLLHPDHIEYLLRSHAANIVNNANISEHISIDGKALKGSKTSELRCLYSVSAWCHENGLVLAEKQMEEKSNEITAIPLLLNSLYLKGKTVSIDAGGCQKSIAKQIVANKGNYVLALKKNHLKLYNAVEKLISNPETSRVIALHDAFDDSHGRTVRRRYFSFDASAVSMYTDGWDGIKTIIAVETISKRKKEAEIKAEWRFYLTNHNKSNLNLPHYVRNHWGIEYRTH